MSENTIPDAQLFELARQFGDAVEHARHDKGWTQEECASHVPCSLRTWQRVEKGQLPEEPNARIKLENNVARVLEVPLVMLKSAASEVSPVVVKSRQVLDHFQLDEKRLATTLGLENATVIQEILAGHYDHVPGYIQKLCLHELQIEYAFWSAPIEAQIADYLCQRREAPTSRDEQLRALIHSLQEKAEAFERDTAELARLT